MNVPTVFKYLNSVRISYDHKFLLQARSDKKRSYPTYNVKYT